MKTCPKLTLLTIAALAGLISSPHPSPAQDGAPPVQTVYVHPIPDDDAASGTALLKAVNEITDASATKHYVVKIEPGTYSIGAAMLTMKPFVDLEGSGQQATVIRGAGATDESRLTGLIKGARSAEIRNLQVVAEGAERSARIAILVDNADTSITDVTVRSGGAGSNWGIRNANAATPTIEDTTIFTSNGSINYGISNDGSSVLPVIKRTVVDVSGETATGIAFFGGALAKEMRDLQIHVSSGKQIRGVMIDTSGIQPDPNANYAFRITGSTVAVERGYGIYAHGPSITINVEQSQIRAAGAGTIGIYNADGAVVVDHSEIAAEDLTVLAGEAKIGATRLEGGAVPLGKCAGVYDESFTFYAGPKCP
jgi:hypothetical protein